METGVARDAVAEPGLNAKGGVRASAHRRGGRWIGLAVVFIVALAAGIAWWLTRGGEPVRYITTPATRGTVARTITATGTVNPILTILVGTYVSGVIQDISCDYNTEVRKGQLCAKIDPRPYQTAVDQAKAELATAQAQLAKDKVNLDFTRLTSDRYADLQTRNLISQDAAASAKNAYGQAAAQIALDQATVQLRQAALEAAQINLGYTDIVSPVDGTVVSRNVTMGQTVAASFQTPTLFVIATDLTQMQVDASVGEADIGGVADGNKAGFSVEAFVDRRFDGVVTQVRQSPQSVQNVITYDVVITVDNAHLLLKPGMTATVRIVTAEHDNVLRVPASALRYTPTAIAPEEATAPAGKPGTGTVWVLRGGKPERVAIQRGLDDESFTEVTGGALAPGDLVIVGEQRGAGNGTGTANAAGPRMHL
jgi:HlyD family secretion protein